MTGTKCDLFTHKSSRSYLNHLVHRLSIRIIICKCYLYIFIHNALEKFTGNKEYLF